MNTLRTLFFSALLVSNVVVFAEDGESLEEPAAEVKKIEVEPAEVELEEVEGGVVSRVGSGVVALAYLPVKLIDLVGDKVFIESGIKGFATLGFLNGSQFGNWLTNHNKGLSRAVVVAIIGGAVYYYWKKCQESKQKQDGSFRGTKDLGLDVDDAGYFTIENNGNKVAKST